MLLIITHISNLLLISIVNSRLFFEASTQSLPKLQYLQIFGLTVYIFIHKKKQKAESAKLKIKKKQEMFLRYNGHIIYPVHLPDKEKII